MIAMDDTKAVMLSPNQAIKLLSIGVLLKDEDLAIYGDDAELATEALCDICEEMAIQLHGYDPDSDL